MIAIVTDSTVCLSKKEAAAYGVRVVPQNYIINGKGYKETYTDNFGSFIPLLNMPDARTAQPDVGDFYSAFYTLTKKGYDIVCITISSRLSSAYYNAILATKKMAKGNVKVIDAGLTAGGLYLLVKRARYLAFSGLNLSEVVGGVYKYIPSIQVRFSVDNLEGLRRSHRLVSVRRSVGTMLNHKPLMRIKDGIIIAEDTAFGNSDRIKMMFKGIPYNVSNLIIHYISPSKNTDTVIKLAHRLFPDIRVEHRQLGPVLGVHLGPSVMGVVWSN